LTRFFASTGSFEKETQRRAHRRVGLSKDDLAKMEGVVTDTKGGGNYVIQLENGITLSAKLSGNMKRFRIRVLVGDKVTVGVSPYDPSHGLILFRQKQ
jgi:translation initiation factor IF-1